MARPLLLVALVALLPACRPGQDAEASEPLAHEAKRREATPVRTAPVLSQEMVRTLSTTRTIESAKQIEVFPRVAGVILAVNFEEGAAVRKDDVLATIDSREAQGRLDDALLAQKEANDALEGLALAVKEAHERSKRAELAFEQAKSEYDRNAVANLISDVDLGKLRLARDTSERDWEAAKVTHEKAQHDLKQQDGVIARADLTVARERLALSFTEITAPFDGVVAARKVRVGDTVSTGAAAFTLTDAAHLRCIVPRPQVELPFFQAARAEGGQIDIRIIPEAYPQHVYGGTIAIVSPTIEPTSGNFRLTIDLEQPGPQDERPPLLPGMLVRVSIVTERHADALVVPKRALRREGDRHFLYVDEDGLAARVEVIEGFSDDERVEVVPVVEGSLVVGTPVVVVGNRDLEDGERIEAEAWSPAGAAVEGELADGQGEPGEEVALAPEGEEPASPDDDADEPDPNDDDAN